MGCSGGGAGAGCVEAPLVAAFGVGSGPMSTSQVNVFAESMVQRTESGTTELLVVGLLRIGRQSGQLLVFFDSSERLIVGQRARLAHGFACDQAIDAHS